MKVISPIFSEMSGKLGGAVGAKARGGVAYLRALVIPGNPNTEFQTGVRNVLTGLAGLWRSTLTNTERATWEDLAASSNPQASGIGMYVKANTPLLLGGGTRVDTAPDSASAILTPPASVVADEGDNDIIIELANVTDPWAATEGGVLLVFATRQQSPSRLAQQFSFRQIGSLVRGASPPATTQAFGYPAGLGVLTTGRVVYIRIVSVDVTGRVSGSQNFRRTVTA